MAIGCFMNRPKNDPTVVRDLIISVFGMNGRLVESGNHLVRNAGLTTAWWQVLGALGYSPAPLPVAHIARNMGLTRQSVQRVVDLLAEHGLVALERNPHHQRAKLVVLTPAGRAALAAAEAAEEPLNRLVYDRIGAKRIADAIAVLSEVDEVIARYIGTLAADLAVVTSERKDAA